MKMMMKLMRMEETPHHFMISGSSISMFSGPTTYSGKSDTDWNALKYVM